MKPFFSSAADGKKTGDGTGVGLFIPLPEPLASQFPSLGDNDNSPPHCTFLYVGTVAKNQEKLFLDTLTQVFTDWDKSVMGILDYLEYFIHPEKERRVAVMRVRFNQRMDEIRWKLRDALMDVGIQVDDSFPLVYQPHVTLKYIDGLDVPYQGVVPSGRWTFNSIEVWGLPKLHVIPFQQAPVDRLASKYVTASKHQTSIELMKFLANAVNKLGIGRHVYVVGGAVRNFIIDEPIKDIDIVVDSIGAGKDSAWLAKRLQKIIPARTNLVTNQYGVAILTIKDDWFIGNSNLKGEDIEIANARKESYGEAGGKGYKPHMVEPSTIEEDIVRREFTFNTLLWQMSQLANGPDKAEILDLTGCGKKDLDEGMMRCPSNPNKTFTDDPSRMIRAIKFLIKYGFKIAPDVKAAIKRNAPKLKNIPSGHLSNMIVNLFFEPGYGSRALAEMNKLGLLDVVREIAAKDKAFREALANWADRSAKIDFLFELMDYNMPTGRRLGFLSKQDLVRLRDITAPMSSAEAERIIAPLEQPGKVVDMKKLITEFDLKGSEIRQLTDTLRKAILDDPRMVLTPARLEEAARKRMGKTAKVYTEQDLYKEYNKFTAAMTEMLRNYATYNLKHDKGSEDERRRAMGLKVWCNNSWVAMMMAAQNLVRVILDQKSIPKADTKKMEMAARMVLSARKFPRNLDTWIDRNIKHLNLLKIAVNDWDEKVEGGEELFKLGPFDVHNTVGASDKELEGIKQMFVKGTALVKKMSGPFASFKKVLYGDVFVVGRLKKATVAAWYQINEDVVYTRIMKRADWDDLQGLIHELAHRYWAKFMARDVKTRWLQRHSDVKYGPRKSVKGPKAGDIVPLTINGVKNPKVLKEDGPFLELDIPMKKYPGKNLIIEKMKVFKWLQGLADTEKFPTSYSATSPEEHFCEAMALYALGKLGPDHVKGLEEVFTGKDTSADVNFVQDVQKQVALMTERRASICRVADGFMRRQASYFQAGDPIFFGKYKNKKGWIKGFTKNPKNNAPMVIIEFPDNPRKQDKALGLYNIWHQDIERRAAVDRIAMAALTELRGWKPVPKENPKSPYRDWLSPDKKTMIRDTGGSSYMRWLAFRMKGDRIDLEIANGATFKKMWENLTGSGKPEVPPPNPIKTPPQLRGWKRTLDKQRRFHYTEFIRPDGKYKIREGQPNVQSGQTEWTSWIADYSGRWHLDQMEPGLDKLLRVLNQIDRIAAKFQKKKEVPKADGKGTTTVYEYSEGQIQNRNRDKAKRVEALRGKLDKLHTAIKKDLNSKDEQTRMTALAIGLINDTYERVGNSSSANDGHFGVTGWQVKHVTLGSGKATFKYVGKSGVNQTKTTTDAALVSALRDAMKGKSGSDPIFKGDDFTVDSSKVNAYLEPFDITAKDIRGLHANREVQKALKAIRSSGGKLPTDPKEKEKKLKAEFKQAIEQAAKTVGHEPTTLKNQYLVPGLEDNYLKDGTVKENLAQQKKASVVATKDHGEREDEETEKLVKPLPKKNPPRHDLRNERVEVDKDKDDNTGADDDKDMSLNYKRVAVDLLARRWILKQAAEKRNPGDIWETAKGWSVKLEEGNIQRADSESEAKTILDKFRSGKKPEDESGSGKKPKTEDSGDTIRKDFSGVDKKSPIFKEVSQKHGKEMTELALYMKAIHDGADVELPPKLVKSKVYKNLADQIGHITPQNRQMLKHLMTIKDSPWNAVLKDWKAAEKAAKPKEEPAPKPKEEPTPKDEQAPEDKPQDAPAPKEEPAPPKTKKQERFEEAATAYKDFVADVKNDKRFKSVLKDISDFDDPQEVMTAFQDQVVDIRAEIDAGQLSPETIQAASDALEDPSGGGMASPEMVGRTLALAMVAKKLIANPLYRGGQSSGLDAEGTIAEPNELIRKARDTANYYSSLTPSLRQEAIAETKKIFKGLAEDSTQRYELDKLADGIHHAATIQGDYDDPRSGNESLRPPPGPGLRSVLQVLAAKGEDKDILDIMVNSSGDGLGSPDAKKQIKAALNDLSDDDLYEACGGENGPDSITIDLLKSGNLSTKERDYVKKMLVDGLTDSISSHDEITARLARAEKRLQKDKKVKEDGKTPEKTQDQKSETQTPGDSDSSISHDKTDLCWTCPPEDGGPTLQEQVDNLENTVRKDADGIRGSMVECMIKATSPEAHQKCLKKIMPRPVARNANENDELRPPDPWEEAQNVYRLSLAEARLRALEKTFGELPIDEPFKVQIQTAIKLFDADELDKRYIREGEKLGNLL